ARSAVSMTAAGNETSATASMDAQGDFVIGWANFDGSDSRIRFQQYGQSGAAFGSEVTTATISGYIASESLSMDADGDFVQIWDTGTGINGKRYRVSGALDDTYTVTTSSDVDLPKIASNGDGDFVAIWERLVGGQFKIDLQQYAYNEAPYDLSYA